ncbi:hypothetical protein RND81_13G041500 [Saponaria officinalis]|uniref:AP2/ERF domain-containing protein n=1 Tax=Saponaria officinalis TaxID=3572 RepID=A0AAW1H415_SAPOF
MDDSYGQCSNRERIESPSDEDVLLASSCPKKRAGRKKFKETRHPVYRGVRQRNGNRWVCEVRTPIDNSRIWLGTYPTAEMAARAHDVAALALRGRMACLNFADSAWQLPVPASADTRDIQRAAAEAGEAFRPPEPSELSGIAQMTQGDGIVSALDEKSCDEVYMDEEAVFNMPRLLDNMAQGLLLPPPSNSFEWEDDTETDCEVSLWNY